LLRLKQGSQQVIAIKKRDPVASTPFLQLFCFQQQLALDKALQLWATSNPQHEKSLSTVVTAKSRNQAKGSNVAVQIQDCGPNRARTCATFFKITPASTASTTAIAFMHLRRQLYQ